jgi:hypothetical protein
MFRKDYDFYSLFIKSFLYLTTGTGAYRYSRYIPVVVKPKYPVDIQYSAFGLAGYPAGWILDPAKTVSGASLVNTGSLLAR